MIRGVGGVHCGNTQRSRVVYQYNCGNHTRNRVAGHAETWRNPLSPALGVLCSIGSVPNMRNDRSSVRSLALLNGSLPRVIQHCR